MTKLIRYAATFANGDTAARGSKREYLYAWTINDADGTRPGGVSFARDLPTAQAAARAYLRIVTGRADLETVGRLRPAGKNRRLAGPAWYKWAREAIADKGGVDAWEAEVIAREARFSLEIVPVHIVA